MLFLPVVSKMVSVAHFSTPPQTELIGKMTENADNKIPHYAENYKKEYLFIRGLNKEFKYFTKKMDSLNHGLFESKKVNRIKNIMKDFLKGQEKGKLKNISGMILPEYDVDKLNSINKKFEFYKLRYDSYCDGDTVYSNRVIDEDGNVEYFVDGKPYPGFIEFYDIFKKIYNQIKFSDDDDSDYEDYEDYEIILPFSDDDSDDF